ncbi:hypothetical protein [Altererythrobacter sp. C41]|uniref:hypothetical protein n=1 Tax=Altererythrobacter sp. C41 TaxID=2806021 RepID=UPI001EE469C5|nr:hypothetical protein [Altererythrobacter sp. C41]
MSSGARVIEVEIQNETHQTQERLRFASVPRIGEGIRLREPDGCWASYDVLDVWYQKAEFGDVWMPYLHVCMTPDEQPAAALQPAPPFFAEPRSPAWGEEEVPPFTG